MGGCGGLSFTKPLYLGSPVSEKTPSETVWKIRMDFTLESHEALKRGEKRPHCRFAPSEHVIQTRKAIFQTVSLRQ
jgi:hypothetical protein